MSEKKTTEATYIVNGVRVTISGYDGGLVAIHATGESGYSIEHVASNMSSSGGRYPVSTGITVRSPIWKPPQPEPTNSKCCEHCHS